MISIAFLAALFPSNETNKYYQSLNWSFKFHIISLRTINAYHIKSINPQWSMICTKMSFSIVMSFGHNALINLDPWLSGFCTWCVFLFYQHVRHEVIVKMQCNLEAAQMALDTGEDNLSKRATWTYSTSKGMKVRNLLWWAYFLWKGCVLLIA